MTPAAYRIWRKGRELTHQDMSRLLGVDASTSRRYEDGSMRIPQPVARLMRLFDLPGARELLEAA